MPNLPVLHLVPRGETEACSFWRVWRPCTLLERGGYPAYWDYIKNDKVSDVLERFGAVVNQRVGWHDPNDGPAFVRAFNDAGIAVWCEHDDDVWHNRTDQLSESEMGFEDGTELTPAQNAQSVACYNGALVSTERLRTILGTVAPDLPVEVVGNYIDLEYWADLDNWERLPELRGVVTVGWFGGKRRDADIAPLAAAWAEVARARPAVRFVVQGYVPEILRAAVPDGRFYALPWLPVVPRADDPARVWYGVGLLNIDVACCSVADTLFNRAKTPIKIWEATLAGAAVCASPVLYGPYIDNGVDGYVCDTTGAWVSRITSLIDNAGRRRRLNAAMRERIAARYSLADNVWRWPAAWSRLHAEFKARQSRRVMVPT